MRLTVFICLLLAGIYLPVSCSKTGGIPPPPPPDPCTLVSINLSGTAANPSVAGASDGSIAIIATGGSGFSFSMNGGSFQSAPSFRDLPAGNYYVVAKNSDGCLASIAFVLTNPAVQCSLVNIVVTTNTGSNIPCEPNTAAITVSATGGVMPYTFSIDGGSFQTANSFNNVSSGSHVITVKDANGCTGTASTTVTNQSTGSLFTQVKGVIQYYCLYCHNNTTSSGGVNYSSDCNIVTGKQRIKERAVDGNPTPMPSTGLIPASERQKIINWINAGGRFSD